ncbi:MAG: hypothetical protein IJ521_02885, partial [Schwartzia sp.]|nr:hypothetical protein [Schwartzia sp. (in: firmicutes)]
QKIDESGLKIYFIAKKIGISYQGLLNKMRNESEFKASEIQALSEILRLSAEEKMKIFFA